MAPESEREIYCQLACKPCGRTPGYVGKCGTPDAGFPTVPYTGNACPTAVESLKAAANEFKVKSDLKKIAGLGNEATLYVNGTAVARITSGIVATNE